jgi:hypothetical protein
MPTGRARTARIDSSDVINGAWDAYLGAFNHAGCCLYSFPASSAHLSLLKCI